MPWMTRICITHQDATIMPFPTVANGILILKPTVSSFLNLSGCVSLMSPLPSHYSLSSQGTGSWVSSSSSTLLKHSFALVSLPVPWSVLALLPQSAPETTWMLLSPDLCSRLGPSPQWQIHMPNCVLVISTWILLRHCINTTPEYLGDFPLPVALPALLSPMVAPSPTPMPTLDIRASSLGLFLSCTPNLLIQVITNFYSRNYPLSTLLSHPPTHVDLI